MPDFAVRTAFTATDKISPAFKRMSRSADVFGSRGSRAMSKVRGATSGLMTSMKGLLPLFGVAVIANYAKKAVDLASALTEVQNVVDTTFGKGAKQINKWSKTAISQFGLSELQAKKFTGTLGAMMKSSGITGGALVKMSTDLVGLSGDLVSFYDIATQEEAFAKIRSGIAGQSEPLRQLGIDLSVANLQSFALSKGITKSFKSMSQAEKMTLRYNLILKLTKDQQGDFNKTLMTSYANQKKVLGVQFDQFLANILVKILPKLTKAFSYLNKAIAKIDTDKIATGLEILVKTLPYVVGGFLAYKTVLVAVSIWQAAVSAVGFIKYFAEMMPVMRAAIKAQGLFQFALKGTALWQGIMAVKSAALAVAQGIGTAAQWALNAAMSANPIGLVIVAIAALIGGIIALVKNWDTLKASFGDTAWGRAILFIIDGIMQKINQLKSTFSGISALLSGDMGRIKQEALKMSGQAPNKSQVESQKVRLDGQINIAGAPTGSTASSKTKGASPINMNLVGQNP